MNMLRVMVWSLLGITGAVLVLLVWLLISAQRAEADTLVAKVYGCGLLGGPHVSWRRHPTGTSPDTVLYVYSEDCLRLQRPAGPSYYDPDDFSARMQRNILTWYLLRPRTVGEPWP